MPKLLPEENPAGEKPSLEPLGSTETAANPDPPPKPRPRPVCGKDSNFKGKKGRSGAPPRHCLTAGKLPRHLAYIENKLNAFRRHVESLVMDTKGTIDITDAMLINSALKWERHGRLAQHWLRQEGDKLKVAERLRFSEVIAKASDCRDKAIDKLKLNAPQKAPWEALVVHPVEEGSNND